MQNFITDVVNVNLVLNLEIRLVCYFSLEKIQVLSIMVRILTLFIQGENENEHFID